MSNSNRYDIQLRGVVNALSQSIREASDEELLEDARQCGVDVKANAAGLKQMFSATAKAYQKRHLLKAQADYAREASALETTAYPLPISPAEQRMLLQLVAAQAQTSGSAFTAKFRNLETLSDADV